jgi:nitrate reductase NapAB chaperone NapD
LQNNREISKKNRQFSCKSKCAQILLKAKVEVDMAVASYLVFTQQDKMVLAYDSLRELPFCEPYLADDRNCLVLVTETPDSDAEKFLQGQFENLTCITGMAMICGFQDECAEAFEGENS